MANSITVIRIICSIGILFVPVFSPAFYVLYMIPVLDILGWLYIWGGVIALIKVINIISGYVMRKEFIAVHTVMNKVTGIALFLFPLTLSMIDLKYSGAFVCALAAFAAIQEGHLIRIGGRVNE